MKPGTIVLVATVAAVAGFLLGRGVQPRSAPWKPVLEETGFEYLQASVDRLAAGLEQARETGDLSGDAARGLPREVRRLQRYYVPLTEVRQLVYDADRLLYLGDREGARRNLLRAKGEVVAGALAAGHGVKRALEEVAMMVDRALLAVEEGDRNAPVLFRELGHRLNLMLLRGEIALSDEDFTPPR